MAGMIFKLSLNEVAEINKPVNGIGGHQTLMKSLQGKLKASGEISLTDGEVGRIIRYAHYSQGGFQNRFKAAFGRSFREAMT